MLHNDAIEFWFPFSIFLPAIFSAEFENENFMSLLLRVEGGEKKISEQWGKFAATTGGETEMEIELWSSTMAWKLARETTKKVITKSAIIDEITLLSSKFLRKALDDKISPKNNLNFLLFLLFYALIISFASSLLIHFLSSCLSLSLIHMCVC